MKRIASFVLCLTLLVTSISQLAVSSLAAESPTITCTSKECNPGDTVSIEVNLSNNPGIMYLEITPTYSAELGSPTVQNGSIMSDLTKGKQYVWTADEDVSANGNLLTMTFTVNEFVAPGNYAVGFIFRSAYNYGENLVTFTVVPATVTVKAKPVPVTGIALDGETASIGTGETLTLTPIFSPETATNKNVTWSSSDKTIATVENGIVTPFKKGTTTITVTTEDGGFSASCVVTVNCSHLNTTDVPAEDSTCIKHGHKAYTICNDCREITRGSNSELPLGDHIGGTATCVKKAVCDVCHKEYGNLAAHKYGETVKADYLKTAATCGSKAVYYKSCSICGIQSEETFETGDYDYTNHIGETYLKNQKEATCYNEGYTGDTYCRTCDKEISKGQPIAKSAHNPASVWTTDETSHWKECQTVGCGNIIDKAAHSGGEATCVNKAICSVCKVEYGAVDSSNHKHTEVRDAKDATCCEQGYTGDTWCTDCNTKISYGNDIPATGKHTDADGKWETDGKNHWHTCYFGTKFDLTAHSGGEATCISKPKCAVCGTEYGNLDTSNHKHTEVRNAKEATCCEKGYTGDTWCTDCSTKISSGSDIPATGKHTDADGKWETDGTNHWHTCYFGTRFDVTAHSGGEATCKDKAVCSVCGTAYGELDALNHKGTTYLKDQKEATCYEEGYTGDTYCSDCNVKIKDGTVIAKTAHNPASVWTTDATHHWKVCEVIGCGNLIDKAEHSGGEATCVTKAVCSVCGAQYGELDPNNHTHIEVRDTKAATEQEKGYTGDTWCLDCNKKVAEGKDIEMLEHKLVLVKAEGATAAKEGNIKYYYCENCGKYYSDEAGTKEITKEDTVVSKLAPKIIDGNNAKIDKSSKEPVSFRSDAAFADFIRVEVDGKELVKDKDYTLKEGSIIATLTPEFVATLSAGEHTLGIVSASGTAVANFTVTDDNASSDNSTDNTDKSPQTGDNSNIIFWSLISVISLAVLCTTGLIFKKKRVR